MTSNPSTGRKFSIGLQPEQITLPPTPAGMDEAEWAQRLELAACYRLFDHMGWTELIYNHISVRVASSGTDVHYLINPFGLHYTGVTASNLVKIDVDGQVVGGKEGSVNLAGFVIHSAINGARADAHCVLHVHTTAGCAVACKQSGLRHDNFYSAILYGDLAYHDYEGITTNADEQPRLIASLGAASHLILRNHGLLVIGEDVPTAFHRIWTLQRACEIQLASDAGAGGNHEIATSILERVPASRTSSHGKKGLVFRLAFEAMLRRAGIDRGDLA